MAKWVLIVFSLTIAACSMIGRDNECSIASTGDGWVKIDKPEGIDENVSIFSTEYLLWFESSDGLVKSCRRDVSYKCLEVGKTYKKINGEWLFQEETDFIVCT